MNCGQSLALRAAGAQESTAAAQTLDRFIPPELMRKLEAARARDAMLGERRVITMLFCDVKGSTAAAERVDPEVWTDIINGVFDYMIRPIYKYEGLVPRLMGDAILAFFGAPIAHEDDPQRAVLAGLEIQEGIKPYAEQVRLQHGLEFGLRVGINTGLVVVGEIGSDLRMEYTAIGDAINLAARMEQTAAAGAVQISEDTYKLVAPFFDVEPLGEVEVKGKSTPVKTYRVLGSKASPGQLRGLQGLPSPLVGREAQMAALNERLEQLEKGAGAVVAVIGEAGLGKSSLIAELKRSNERAGCKWLKGEALSYARSISYFLWRQVIRQSIRAHQDDSPAEVRHKLRYVCDCCTLPGGDIPFLEAMLAVESEESSQVVMGYQGEALIQRMTEAVRGYLCGLAAEAPLVIAFDDLHWADEASLNLLLSLVDLAGSQPILFICMSRPDKTVPGWDVMTRMQQVIEGRYHRLELEPLQAEQTDVLLTNLLGIKGLPKNVRDLIVEKADGNPFFIEELIRSLIETKQIVRENSHWKAMNADAKISLPNTLRGVLSARIDRLPESSRHVLQHAAVIGRSFDLRVLKRLTGLNGGLDAHIQYLEEASLIEPLRDEYAFRHILVQEAAYDSILIKQRAQLHRQIGEISEELYVERIEEAAPLLAHHFYAAQDPRSLKYDLLAGEKAARLYANAEAATHFSRALEVARRIPIDKQQITKLYMKLGQSLELSARYEQALENYEEMQTFGRERGGRSAELTALMAKATIYSTYTSHHDPVLSEQTLIRALELSQAIGDRAAQVRLNWNLMLTYLFSSRLEQALVHGELALPLARELEDREPLAFVLNDLCRLYVCLGRFEDAHAVIHEARDLWRALNIQTMLADSFGSEAEACFQEGDHEKALELLRQGLELSEEIENSWGKAYNRMLMSFIYFDRGEIGRAIRLSAESIEEGDRGGLVASSTSHRAELGWFYGLYGDIEKGLELAEQALARAEEKQPNFRALPLAFIVRLYLLQGDLESAQKVAGPKPLEPITIPYSRYTISVCLANVELALAQKEYERALTLAEDLLAQVSGLTRVDIPDVMRRKAEALAGLNQLNEAHRVLTEACSLAEGMGSKHHLWSVLAGLADVSSQLGQQDEAG
ncbi:MAG TPA: adenylate/guanylate cyclase domain-containing protein, partial [Anaerolineales bacterium]|nr:adenylate/guanylate cyclase domain-containing protein [Anaerolineales bacterium]